MKKNIYLATWYNSINYGTCIQCYALAEYLRNKGYNVYVVNTNKYYYGIKHPIETIKNIIKTIKEKNILKNNKNSINDEYDKLFKERQQKNTNFAYNKTKVLPIKSKKDYNNLINKCTYFISGSDQIWNPKYVTPPMLLSMARKK